MDISALPAFLKELAELAGTQTLPRFRNLVGIESKGSSGFDPVTEADREAERAIRARIMEKFPDHGIEGEEFGTHQPDAQYKWVIDPIDGTRAFIVGIPVWGTLIGLCQDGVPIAGIMSQPFTQECFIACQDRSHYTDRSQHRELKTASTGTLADAVLMSTAPELFTGSEAVAFNRFTQTCRMTRYGADCYAYCMLASGHVDLVIESGLSFYDIAALIPIVENAGGIVTDWQGNPFNDRGQVVAAANTALHRQAIEMLNA